MKFYKKIKKENWERMEEQDKDRLEVFKIPIKQITRVEHSIYNPTRIYLWYTDTKKKRTDLEFQRESDTNEVTSKVKYIMKAFNNK